MFKSFMSVLVVAGLFTPVAALAQHLQSPIGGQLLIHNDTDFPFTEVAIVGPADNGPSLVIPGIKPNGLVSIDTAWLSGKLNGACSVTVQANSEDEGGSGTTHISLCDGSQTLNFTEERYQVDDFLTTE